MSLDALLFQQDGRCFYCGQPLPREEIAVVVPFDCGPLLISCENHPMKMKVFFCYEDEEFFSPIGTVDAADSQAVIERDIRQHISRFDDYGQQLILEIRQQEGVVEVVGLRNLKGGTPPAPRPFSVF